MLLKKTSHALHFNLGNSSSDQVEPQAPPADVEHQLAEFRAALDLQYLIYENLLAVVILTLV
jgi:hypothetical protein